MKIEYCITNENGKYYQSNHEWVGADCRWVDDEIDATFMNESDLLYLVNESELRIGKYGRIHVALNQLYIGSISIDDFTRPIGEGK